MPFRFRVCCCAAIVNVIEVNTSVSYQYVAVHNNRFRMEVVGVSNFQGLCTLLCQSIYQESASSTYFQKLF